MSRIQGTVNAALSYERQLSQPLDATSVVSTVADLTNADTFITPDKEKYCYYGMLVSVTEKGDNNVYKLIDLGDGKLANEAQLNSNNWVKIGGAASDLKLYKEIGDKVVIDGKLDINSQYQAKDTYPSAPNNDSILGWYINSWVIQSDNTIKVTLTNNQKSYDTIIANTSSADALNLSAIQVNDIISGDFGSARTNIYYVKSKPTSTSIILDIISEAKTIERGNTPLTQLSNHTLDSWIYYGVYVTGSYNISTDKITDNASKLLLGVVELNKNNIIVGKQNAGGGEGSLVIGSKNFSTARYAFTTGQSNFTTGHGSFNIGFANTTNSWMGLVVGRNNYANGNNSIAIGAYNTSIGRGNILIGAGLSTTTSTATSDWKTVVGRANVDDKDALFIIGNGTFNSNNPQYVASRSNALAVYNDHITLGNSSTTVGVDSKLNVNKYQSTTTVPDYGEVTWPNKTQAKGWYLAWMTNIEGANDNTKTGKHTARIYLSKSKRFTAEQIWGNTKPADADIISGDDIKNVFEENDVLGVYNDQHYPCGFYITALGDNYLDVAVCPENYPAFNLLTPLTKSTASLIAPFRYGVIITGSYDTKTKLAVHNSNKVDKGVVDLTINSFNLGDSNTTGGYVTAAMGADNETYGAYATVLGKSNINNGYGAVSIGGFNNTKGTHCIGLGRSNTVYGTCNIAIGGLNNVNSGIRLASGANLNSQYNNYSTAIGFGNTIDINGDDVDHCGSSIVIGYGLLTHTKEQTIVGKFNAEDSNAAFIIGNGTWTNNRKNIFTVSKDGSVKTTHTIEANALSTSNTTRAMGWYVQGYKQYASTSTTPESAMTYDLYLGRDQYEFEKIVSTGKPTSWVKDSSLSKIKANMTLTFYNNSHFVNGVKVLSSNSDGSIHVKPIGRLYTGTMASLPPRKTYSMYPFRYGVFISGVADASDKVTYDYTHLGDGIVDLTNNSLVIGGNDIGVGYCASTIGMDNVQLGQYGQIVGKTNIGSGYCSLTVGQNNTNDAGEKAFIAGGFNYVNKNYASTIGKQLSCNTNIVENTPQLVIGQYNNPDEVANIMFAIGGGDNYNSKKNIFLVDKSGNTTITGTISGKNAATIDGNLTVKGNTTTVKNINATGLTTTGGDVVVGSTGNVIIGQNNQTAKKMSVVAGTNINTLSAGGYNVVGGNSNIIKHEDTGVFGKGLETTNNFQAVVGEYNSGNVSGDCSFIVGCGLSDTTRFNGLMVKRDGSILVPVWNAAGTSRTADYCTIKACKQSDGSITLKIV